MEVFDCVVIGAGPAGLSASLTLGRARRRVAVFDDETNRNRVTNESHGFLTRDGIKPAELKRIGLGELTNYPSVSVIHATVTEIERNEGLGRFIVRASNGDQLMTEKVLLATGVQETFMFAQVKEYYGRSLFSCPYCDGWELRDKPLVVIAPNEEQALHMAKLVHNWSKDLIVATNGVQLSAEANFLLIERGIVVKSEPIKRLFGKNGYLQAIEFQSGEALARSGGFVVPLFYRPNQLADRLGCNVQKDGAVATDGAGRTTVKHIYIAGETEKGGPSSLMVAAADGSKAAFAVNTDLTMERF